MRDFSPWLRLWARWKLRVAIGDATEAAARFGADVLARPRSVHENNRAVWTDAGLRSRR